MQAIAKFSQATNALIESAAKEAREEFGGIGDSYMNEGDALSDAIWLAVERLFPNATDDEQWNIVDAVYVALDDIEVN